MSRQNSPLDHLKVASPCSADWNEMYGSDRKRFCGDCKLNVYNLSGMTRTEAENLLMNSEGRLCVRYYRRSDGTVLTQDCPVGWATVRQRLSVYSTAMFSLFLTFLSGVFFASMFRKGNDATRRIPTIFTSPAPDVTMGAIAVSPEMGKARMGEAETPANQSDRRRPELTVGRVDTDRISKR